MRIMIFLKKSLVSRRDASSEDCFGSVGDLTYYHRDGKCFYKRRACPDFPGTLAQMEQQSVHLRAIAAWQGLSSSVQKEWNAIAPAVVVHRPPFDGKAHMSGYNLFVSAYHGLATLGEERVPDPLPWVEFPVFSLDGIVAAGVQEGALRLRCRVTLEESAEGGRYWLLLRLHLAKPGGGRNDSRLRTFLAESPLAAGVSEVEVIVPEYVPLWGLDLPEYSLHCRYMLLDARSGYRNLWKPASFPISL